MKQVHLAKPHPSQAMIFEGFVLLPSDLMIFKSSSRANDSAASIDIPTEICLEK
jgi:hypothetical protein